MAKVLGLTGGIASGKSTVAAMLRARGAAVVDADLLARQVVEPGQPALTELVVRFGPAILAADGTLDRKALAAVAFADPAARADLNRITHPRIAAAAQAAIAAQAAAGAPVVFYEAALLIENGLHRGLDGTVVVAVSPAVQVDRLAARDQLAADAVRARMAAQLPLADKLAVATWVVDNDGDRDALAAEVDRLWASIEERFGQLVAPPRDRPVERMLVTGLPGATARALIRVILARDADATIAALVPHDRVDQVAADLAGLAPADRQRVTLLTGDAAAMDLGLSTAEYRALAAEVTTIHHLGAAFPLGRDAASRGRHRLASTRGILELAGDAPHLRRVMLWSSVQVASGRGGLVGEIPLPAPARGASRTDRALHDAEHAAVTAMARLPITIIRIGHVVALDRRPDDRDDAIAGLIRWAATRPPGLPLPLPGNGAGPLQVVPVDYVVAAAHHLAGLDRAAGRVFHLVDPQPPTVRAALDRIATLAGLPAPRGSLPRGLVRAFLRTPGLDRFAELPAAMLALVSERASFACTDTLELLTGTGIACPPFDAWIAPVVERLEPPAPRRTPPKLDDSVDPLG